MAWKWYNYYSVIHFSGTVQAISLFLSNKMSIFCCVGKPSNNKDKLLHFPVILPAPALRKDKHKQWGESFLLHCKVEDASCCFFSPWIRARKVPPNKCMMASPALPLSKENSLLIVLMKRWDGGCASLWDGFGSWWLNKETARKPQGRHLSRLPSRTCLLLSSHNGLLAVSAACQTCSSLRALALCLWCSSLRSPNALLNLKLHCLHPLVLPPDCLIALRKSWHITNSVCLLFTSPTRMSVPWQHQ